MTTTLSEPPPVKHHALWGGGRIQGDTPRAIVRALRGSSFSPGRSERAFMEDMSDRCKFYSGAIISTWDHENFVADLIHHGFLKEVDPNEPEMPDNIVDFEYPEGKE